MTSFFAGCLSGLVEVTVTHPLDSAKTCLQQRRAFVAKHMYRGVTSRWSSVLPMRGILWSAQKEGRRVLSDASRVEKSVVIGSAAGACQSVVDIPAENIKLQRMRGLDVQYNVGALSRGVVPNTLRNMVLCTGIVAGSLTGHTCGVALGSFVGCITSQPFDYMKTAQQSSISMRACDVMKGWQFRAFITPLNMLIGYNVFKCISGCDV